MRHREFTQDEARDIGQNIGIDFTIYDIEQFRKGLAIELEHGSHDQKRMLQMMTSL